MAEDSGSGGSGPEKIKFSDEAAQNLQNKVEQLRSALVSNPDLTDIRDKIPQVLPGSSPNAQQLRDKIKQFLDRSEERRVGKECRSRCSGTRSSSSWTARASRSAT